MSDNFTKGPWAVSTSFGSVGAIQHINGFVAFPCAPRSVLYDRLDGESFLDMCNRTEQARKDIDEEEAANGRLLAAAPDLLGMVGKLMRIIESGIPDLEDVNDYQMAKELLGKIHGGSA